MKKVQSYCRICNGSCGLVLTIDDDGRLVGAIGDHDHPMSQGYACIKGLQSPAIHNGPQRLRKPLKRQPDGSFAEIGIEDALDEIADRLGRLLTENGPDALAMFRGTQGYANTAATNMARGFLDAIGAMKFYSTMTIDQSAKWVTDERLGSWDAGRHRIDTADVFMCFGYNPLVSVQGGYGFYPNNPTRRMKELKARGLRLIVIDPRRTETAAFADIHLQPLPGTDAIIAAGMLREILVNGHEDRGFVERWAPGVHALSDAVADFTPDYVAARAGIDADDFRRAVRLFVHEGTRGIAMTGTGPDMADFSNLANHLIECINVVCGRFNRAGEPIANSGVLLPFRQRRAEARAPRRRFEQGLKTRVRGLGQLMGEFPSCTLPEDIVTPGEGRIRALFNVGGNPASVFPDPERTVAALAELDLLVSIAPAMSNTARLSHYILPPKLMFERPDGPNVWETISYPVPFAQYTPALVSPPMGSEVCDEWYPFWAIAKRLGRQIIYCGHPLDMDTPPDTEFLLDLVARGGQVPLSEVRKHPTGFLHTPPEPYHVQPARLDCTGYFEVLPHDVADEIAALRSGGAPASPEGADAFPFRLAVRRMREVINSAFHDIPAIRDRMPYNPLAMNPEDMDALGLVEGMEVSVRSDHGTIDVIVKGDASLRRGVVTLSHGFGGLPGEKAAYVEKGANVNALVSIERDVQDINAMPRFSGIPISISPATAR